VPRLSGNRLARTARTNSPSDRIELARHLEPQDTDGMATRLAKLVFFMRPKRSWLQFRLRTLFFLVTVASKKLISRLSHESPKSRMLAAIALGLVRPKNLTVVPVLASALDDNDQRVRQAACLALSESRSEADIAIPAIRRVYEEARSPGQSNLAAFESLLNLNAQQGFVSYVFQRPMASAEGHAIHFVDRIYPGRKQLSILTKFRTKTLADLADHRKDLEIAEDDSERRSCLARIEDVEALLLALDNEIAVTVADSE
jgi:hypothetical protein